MMQMLAELACQAEKDVAQAEHALDFLRRLSSAAATSTLQRVLAFNTAPPIVPG